MSISVRPAGERALLVEVAGSDEALQLAHAVRALHADQVEDVVPAHRTVLISWPSGASRPSLDLAQLATQPAPDEGAAPVVTLDVRYSGPDLTHVAQLAGMSPEEVVARHAAARYRVAFVGFAPGFAYLVGGDPRLEVARRERPRPEVPQGSVALAGPYSAVYPSPSPGGWQLIGRTDEPIFDPRRDPPALLPPGATVRFRDRTAAA
jgi:KipI family sensor histidine kinase inhibitor